MMADAFIRFYELAKNSDRVLFHIKTMADTFADQFPEKMIKADVIPANYPTKEFMNPVFSFLPLPTFLYKLTFKLTSLGLKMWAKPVSDFRESVGLSRKYQSPELPSIYGISEHFLKKPKDYPQNCHFTGFWVETSPDELDADLMDFIKEGEPPLVITFGSMTFETKMDLPKAINKLSSELKVRFIVIRGWGFNDIQLLEMNSNIKVIESAPYDKLFPLVKAIIHHGGIGTISACLIAGKPFFACPVLYPMGDQIFWANIAYQKGVAIQPIALKKLTENLLVLKVRELLSNEILYLNSLKLSEKIKMENGIEKAITIIEESIESNRIG